MKTKLFLFIAVLFSAFSINAQINSVAVVGAGVGGWPTGAAGEVDVNQLTRVTPTGDDWIIENLVVLGGGIKLRANNDWAAVAAGGGNWGRPATGSQWPTAVADEGGGSGDINGPSVVPGTYTLTFNTVTKVYNFGGGPAIPVVKLVGSAVANVAGETMTSLGNEDYELTLNLLAGNVQFDVDGAASGSLDYPGGFAADPALSIPIPTAKSYKVVYNNGTGAYTFSDGFVLKKVSLVGAGTTGGWPPFAGEDPIQLKNVGDLNEKFRISELVLTADNVKFRENNDWATTWAGAFPTASGTRGGAGDIAVSPAGTYSVTLDYITNTYNFFTPKVGVIGNSIGGWGDANEVQMTTTDGITYLLLNQSFPGGNAGALGCKFRLDENFDKAWGGVYPSGVDANASGPNISVPIGTYDVTFNRLTGAYTFGAPGTAILANNTFATKSFSVSPNPTSNNWKISSNNEITSVQVVNILGKVVYTSNTTANEVNVDASALSNGVYFARISSANAVETIKLVKN